MQAQFDLRVIPLVGEKPTIAGMDKYERRRRNLAWLRDTYCGGRNADLARKLGKDPSYISRMFYPDDKPGRKRIADDMKEEIERAFGLPVSALDMESLTNLLPGQPQNGAANVDAGHKNVDVRPGVDESTTTKVVQVDPLKEPIEGAIAIRMRGIPVVGTAQFGDEGFWEELQYPVGHGDGFVDFPSRDPNAYALRGSGNSMAPRFRHGEFVIIEPNTELMAGDEVMVRLTNGRTMGKIYAYERDGMVYLESINQDHPTIAVRLDEVEKMHFIAGVAKRSLWRPA